MRGIRVSGESLTDELPPCYDPVFEA